MENSSFKNINDINVNQKVARNFDERVLSSEAALKNPVYKALEAEGGENFFHYIDWLGLAKDPNLMILSSLHHYYYDFNDLTGVKTLINLKMLNHINHIDNFLSNIFRVLPPKANFIGSFKDNKIHIGAATPIYQSFRFLNRLINILDAKTDKFMSRKNVLKILEARGFRVVDMTEINGMTYFYTRINRKSEKQ